MTFKLIALLVFLLGMCNAQSLKNDLEDDSWDELEKETDSKILEFLRKEEQNIIMENPKYRKKIEKVFQVDLNEKETKEIKLIEKLEKKMNFTLRVGKNKEKWIGNLHRKLFYRTALEGKDNDMQSLKHNSKYAVQRLRRFAFDFDINVQGSGNALVVGGSIAIVGGIIGSVALGITLAPFTGGASLAIAIGASAGAIGAVGTGVGAAGLVISTGGMAGKFGWTWDASNKAKAVQELAENEVGETVMIISMLIDAQEKCAEEMKSKKLERAKDVIGKKMMAHAVIAGLDIVQVGKYLGLWQKNNLLAMSFFKNSLKNTEQILKYVENGLKTLFMKAVKNYQRAVGVRAVPDVTKVINMIISKFATKELPVSLIKGWIKTVGKALMNVFNIGFGIWDVYSGARTIQGIGNIGDAFRAAAIELENKVEDIEEAFEEMTERKLSKSTVSEDLNIVEIHTCDNTQYSGTNVTLIISTINEEGKEETCQTKSLNVNNAKSKWNLNIENLGKCTNFMIYNFSAIATIKNTENTNICIDYVTFATGGKFVPSMNCYKDEVSAKVYANSAVSPSLTCTRHPTIARIKTHTCSVCDSSDREWYNLADCPSTKDKISLDIKFLDEKGAMIEDGSCTTSSLNTNNEQFDYDSKDIHRIDTLGDSQTKSFNDFAYKSLETRVFKTGNDDWCSDSLKLYTPGFFKDYNIFKCDVANNGKGTIFNLTTWSNKIPCPLFRAANPKLSIEKMEFHTCSDFYAGTGAVVKMEICDLKRTKCCMTNNLNPGYISSGVKYTIDGDHYLDDGGERLGECESFEIVYNSLLFRINVDSSNGMCLTHVNFFGKNSESIPFMKCDFANDNLWADNNLMSLSSGSYSGHMFQCEDHTYTHITKVSFKMCDVTHSGTDSSIQLEIASGQNSCTTRVLDSSRNDFERGDYNEFPLNNLDDCGSMKIEDGKVAVRVVNTGSDALCLSQTMMFITDGKGNSWIQNCRLDQKGLEEMNSSLCKGNDSSNMWSSNCSNSTGSYIPLICV